MEDKKDQQLKTRILDWMDEQNRLPDNAMQFAFHIPARDCEEFIEALFNFIKEEKGK